MFQRITRSTASPWTILIRLAVGLVVFFPEGIQKLAPKGLEEALPESIHPTEGANKKL